MRTPASRAPAAQRKELRHERTTSAQQRSRKQSHPAGCNSYALSCLDLTAYSTDRTEHELLRHELLQPGASRAVAARATRQSSLDEHNRAFGSEVFLELTDKHRKEWRQALAVARADAHSEDSANMISLRMVVSSRVCEPRSDRHQHTIITRE